MKKILAVIGGLWLSATTLFSQQISYFNQGFLRQQNAAQDLAWLGIGGTNFGLGSVSNFTAGAFDPLFTTTVSNPHTSPALGFVPIAQGSNLVYASPDGVSGVPTFRRLTANDLPGSGGSGTVTSFSSGDLPPLFTTSVATPTTTPALSYNLTSQSANLVFAGPTSGGASAPTFRSLVSGDIPSLSGIYLPLAGGTMSGTIIGPEADMSTVKVDNLTGNSGDTIKLNGPLLINDAAANGQIQDRAGNEIIDPLGNFFGNGAGMSGVVLSVTNGGRGVGQISMLVSTNPPQPSFKSVSAGSGITLTDQGTNVVIGGGGGATNSVDYYMTNLTSYVNRSNYFIDFNFPSATLTSATNVIAFNYGTNFGMSSTSRVCNIFVPATNFGRIVTFTGLATNWHIQPQIYFIPLGYNARLVANAFGTSDSGITMTPFIDTVMTTSNTTASFNPTNALPSVGGIGSKLWLDASVKAWQDETLTVPCVEGLPVRGWTDLTGVMTVVTNNATTEQNLFYHSTQLGPYNVPCMSVYPGQSGSFTWLQAPAITALSQPITIFLMYYGRSGGVVVDSTGGGRVAINPAQMGQSGSAFNSSGISYTSAKTVSWTLVTYTANGASSVMRTNGVVAVSGNAGTTSPSQFIVFGDNIKSVQIGSYNVAEILVCATNMSNTQLTNVESYFYRKYPFWNPPTVQ